MTKHSGVTIGGGHEYCMYQQNILRIIKFVEP